VTSAIFPSSLFMMSPIVIEFERFESVVGNEL
jgi:hypothetical protein